MGHIKPCCPKNPFAFKQSNYIVNFSFDDNSPRKFSTSGTINGSWVSAILRDSGCSCVIVAEQLLPDVDLSSCQWTKVFDYLGRTDTFSLVKCFIRCPYYVGWVKAVRAPLKFCSVLIGNIPGVKDHNTDSVASKTATNSDVSATLSLYHALYRLQNRLMILMNMFKQLKPDRVRLRESIL